MHLTSRNCQDAFRKKADVILKGKSDILVVQECEHTNKVILRRVKGSRRMRFGLQGIKPRNY